MTSKRENKKEYKVPTKEERVQYGEYYVPSKAEREFLSKITDVLCRYLSRYNIDKVHWANEHEVFVFALYGEKKAKLLGLQEKQPISIIVTFKWDGNVITISGFGKKTNIKFSGKLDNKEQLRRGFINYKKRNQDLTWVPRNHCVDENNHYESNYSGLNFKDEDNIFGFNDREENVIPMAIPNMDIAGDFTDLDDCGNPM